MQQELSQVNDYEALAEIVNSEVVRIFNLVRVDIWAPVDFSYLDEAIAKLKTFS